MKICITFTITFIIEINYIFIYEIIKYVNIFKSIFKIR